MIQPLLAEHCQERGKQGGGKTGEEDSLDLDNGVGRACPLRKGGRVISEGGVVDLEDENPEESSGLIIGVRPELGVDLDDEGRSHSGEQTSL